MDPIYIVLGCIFICGLFVGLGIAVLFGESHLRSEIERAFALGEAAGRRSAENLIPFPVPDRGRDRAA